MRIDNHELLLKFIFNVRLLEMKNVLFLICALALFSASFVSAAHAHVDAQGADQQIELITDLDNTNDSNADDPLCDLHCHNHIAPADFAQAAVPEVTNKLLPSLSENAASSLIYGLKRPPRI